MHINNYYNYNLQTMRQIAKMQAQQNSLCLLEKCLVEHFHQNFGMVDLFLF